MTDPQTDRPVTPVVDLTVGDMAALVESGILEPPDPPPEPQAPGLSQ
ncbi:hypothetical protein ACWGI0_23330 [Streptomyces sp. NPDC054802]